MNTITSPFKPHQANTSQTASNHLWRGIGVATVLLVGLTAAALSARRTPADQAIAAWSPSPIAETASFGDGVPPEIFPLGVMAPEAER